MKKKTAFLGAMGMVIMFGLLLSAKMVFATGISSRNILKSINIVGIGAVQPTSMKFQLVDGVDSLSNQTVTLPTITGNNGMVYNIRYIDDGYMYAMIVPQAGEKLEGQTDHTWYLGVGPGDEAVTLVADTETGSWWIMSQSPIVSNTTP